MLKFPDYYPSKWYLSDFYPEDEEVLRAAIESGEDFETNWEGCKKEIHYFRIVRERGLITVEVSVWTDNAVDDAILDDAISAAGYSFDDLAEETVDRLREMVLEDWDESFSDEETLPDGAGFDEVCKALDRLEDLLEKQSEKAFEALVDEVKRSL